MAALMSAAIMWSYPRRSGAASVGVAGALFLMCGVALQGQTPAPSTSATVIEAIQIARRRS
jgi:hypothetical protein